MAVLEISAFLPPLFGSFFGVMFAFLLDYVFKDKHQKFIREYLIKSELRRIITNLRAGGTPKPIKIIYGADYVREHRLFGENGTRVILWYNEFGAYNTQFEDLKKHRSSATNRDEGIFYGRMILQEQEKMARIIAVDIREHWMKKIPDDYSNLSATKFLLYMLKRDALEEPTRNGDFRNAVVDAIGRANDKLANLDYLLAGGS